MTVKLATTRNNLHEKTEELVHTLTSLTQTTTELNETKSTFENYKKEKERIVMEIEERSIAQMQKVVLEIIYSKIPLLLLYLMFLLFYIIVVIHMLNPCFSFQLCVTTLIYFCNTFFLCS